jgi:hypothetical protein
MDRAGGETRQRSGPGRGRRATVAQTVERDIGTEAGLRVGDHDDDGG